jgi:PAS domain S-box-containing protein
MSHEDQERSDPSPREEDATSSEIAPRAGNECGREGAGSDEGDARFAAFAENASDAIIVIDETSTIRFANRAAGETFGYTVEELCGASLTMLMPEYMRHLHRAGMSRYLETGERHISWQGVELPGRHHDGHELELEISFGEFRQDGRRHFTGVARDISARKRAERVRTALHAVTRVLVETEGVGATITRVLQAVGENLRYEIAEYWDVDNVDSVLRCAGSWHAESVEFVEFDANSHARTFRRGEGLPGRVWATGEAAWIADVTRDENFPRAPVAAREGIHAGFAFPVRLGGEVLGVMEFFSREAREPDEELHALMSSVGSQLGQLIERRRAEESLRRAEEAQRFLAQASEMLSASLDYETTLGSIARLVVPYLADWCVIDLKIDERIERVAVANTDSLKVERVWEAVRHTPVNPDASEGVAKVIRTGRADVFPELSEALLAAAYPEAEKLAFVKELGLRSAMLVPMTVNERTLGSISFATAESGRRYAATDLAFAEDLAHRAALAVENARLYREAQEVNRLKDEFLATLSHELRTPLTAILGWAGLLRTVSLDTETAASALETVERNARAQKQLIDDLLDASRIITGKLRLEVRPTQLARVVEAATESIRPAAAAKGIELRVELDKDASLVAGDPDRLQQVIWNLISNAVKFTPREGRVEVSLKREGDNAVISVADTGVGISREFLPQVFDRFRQADASTTRAFGGLGLGLSIVRHLVELHGGTVTVASEGEGKGATFRARLPLATVARGESASGDGESNGTMTEAERADAQKTLSDVRVLVVDDDADTLFMLRKTLERYGARVTACESAREGLRAIEGTPFDVLVSDIGMPLEDGYKFIRRIRQHERARGEARLPALALTAYARREDEDTALAAGFDAHQAKPVAPAELVEAVATLAGRTTRV